MNISNTKNSEDISRRIYRFLKPKLQMFFPCSSSTFFPKGRFEIDWSVDLTHKESFLIHNRLCGKQGSEWIEAREYACLFAVKINNQIRKFFIENRYNFIQLTFYHVLKIQMHCFRMNYVVQLLRSSVILIFLLLFIFTRI